MLLLLLLFLRTSDEHHQSEFAHLGCPDKECRGRSMNIPSCVGRNRHPGAGLPRRGSHRAVWSGAGGSPGPAHHFSHLEAQFLMRCCQHGQGPRSRVLQFAGRHPRHRAAPPASAGRCHRPGTSPCTYGRQVRGSEKKPSPGSGKTYLEPCSLTQDYSELCFEQSTH